MVKEYVCTNKNCKSKNLIIIEKDNQTGLYCADCSRWIKWLGKEETQLLKKKFASTNPGGGGTCDGSGGGGTCDGSGGGGEGGSGGNGASDRCSGDHCYGEFGTCPICHKEASLTRTTFSYPIKCSCHSPSHSIVIPHCRECIPKEPMYTEVEFRTEDLKNPASIGMPLLQEALKKDKDIPGSYYYSWQSNIACAIMDTMPDVENIYKLANEAAKKFLNSLIR